MNRPEIKELTLYPWSMSSTGYWDEDSGLLELAKYARGEIPASEIAQWLWPPGIYVQNSAVIELMDHGNVCPAAALVCALVEAHPVCRFSLTEQFGGLIDMFLANPSMFPNNPSEFPPDIIVRFAE